MPASAPPPPPTLVPTPPPRPTPVPDPLPPPPPAKGWLACAFEQHREHLRSVAYRLLGSMSDADDAVQDTWLRLTSADASEVENLGGWLTTAVARVSLNMLRSRRHRPEQPVGDSWPASAEASAGDGAAAGPGAAAPLGDPENEAVLADSVGLALLVVLDTLTPAERLAFVLHDMFAMPFTEVADVLGRSTEATRQLASRPRRRLLGPGHAAGLRRHADGRRRRLPVRQADAVPGRGAGFPGRVRGLRPGRGFRAGPGERAGGRGVRARRPPAVRAGLYRQPRAQDHRHR